MHDGEETDYGPEIVAPEDPRAQAILDGFRMCARGRCSTLLHPAFPGSRRCAAPIAVIG